MIKTDKDEKPQDNWLIKKKIEELGKTDSLTEIEVAKIAKEMNNTNQADPKYDEFKRQMNKYHAAGMQLAASTKTSIEEPIELMIVAYPFLKSTTYLQELAPAQYRALKHRGKI